MNSLIGSLKTTAILYRSNIPMSPLPTIVGECPFDPPDRTTIRSVADLLDTSSIINSIEYDPNPKEPQLILAHIDPGSISFPTNSARIEIQWFGTRYYSIRYIENRSGDKQWWCQWDRHPNENNNLNHFHCPPDGTPVVDLSLDLHHPIDILQRIVASVEEGL